MNGTETWNVVLPLWDEVPNACKHGARRHYLMNGAFIAEELPYLIGLDLEEACCSVSAMGDEHDEMSELPRVLWTKRTSQCSLPKQSL